MGRVRQFCRAVTARVTADDRAFVARMLPEKALPLFYAMHRADQRHALNVAHTAAQLAAAETHPVDVPFLLRCALLHDVGRQRGDLDILGKVACVLLVHFFPRRARVWAERGQSQWLYIYFHHPAIGAARLRRIGLAREAALIEQHHEAEKADDAIELRLLRAADERN